MITRLDTQSWAKEIETGNAQFVRTPDGTIYIVSNVRTDGSFVILRSDPVPPAAGPGASFTVVATYTFQNSTIDFDPVVVYDATGIKPLLHIIGTESADSPRQINLIKFTFDTTLTGPYPITLSDPILIVRGSSIQTAYDICVIGVNHKLIVAGISNPVSSLLFEADVTHIAISGNVLTVTANSVFTVGQLVKFSSMTAIFLDGKQIQVVTVSATQFTATYYHQDYDAADSGQATPVFSGQSLLAVELDDKDTAGNLIVLANSPERSGNTIGSVSLLTPDGINVEVYYESHPKIITYVDQLFTLYQRNLSSTTGWNSSPTPLTNGATFQGRFTDNRLTAQLDSSGNRYLSQIYYTQSIHPEGLVGNAILGILPVGGSSWTFHPTLGTVIGGSIIQGALAMSQSLGLHYIYLLKPFNIQPVQPSLPASYPLHIGAVSNLMDFTDVPGYYNKQKFTWLRGTKSIVDDLSVWAVVGEQEIINDASETYVIPALFPYTIEILKDASDIGDDWIFWQNVKVVDTSGSTPVTFTPVINSPLEGQYAVQSNGIYTFNEMDAGVGIIGVDLTSNQLTVTASNITRLNQGMKVLFTGLTSSTYLNGQIVVVTQVNSVRSTFSAVLNGSDDPEHADTGYAGKPIIISYTYMSAIVPVYASFYNVPPIAAITPSSAIVYRANSLTLSAVMSADNDNDNMLYIWTENDPDTTNVTLTPSLATISDTGLTIPAGLTVTVNVSRNVKGAARLFSVGLVAIDLEPDGVTLRHPAIPVSNIKVDGFGVITVTAKTNIIVGESVMLWGVRKNTTLFTAVNDRIYTLISHTANSFTATTIDNLAVIPSTPVEGFVIPQQQFAVALITVPFNAAPDISFPTPWVSDAVTNVARNTEIQITTKISTNPLTQFPVIITGMDDLDDAPIYLWKQVSGTPVVMQGVNSPNLIFSTNGIDIQGENLGFKLTASDGVNSPVSRTCTVGVAAYELVGPDTKIITRSIWSGTIAQRNTSKMWGPLAQSAIYSDFRSIKRCSLLDGTDRYIIISNSSILVYGTINPTTLLLRKLFTPQKTRIVDAIHTESDYTMVIDDDNNLFRYSTAPLINTDNPDTTINLSALTSMHFNQIHSTLNHGNVRVLALSGPNGCLLLQVSNDTFNVKGVFELTTSSNLIADSNNVKFIRLSNVEELHSGKVLLGTATNVEAKVTAIALYANTLVVTCSNGFKVGDKIYCSSFSGVASFLNGLVLSVVSVSSINFKTSLEHSDQEEIPMTGLATAINDGKTFETLIDLSQGQIIGTWNSDKLHNQYVNTGEILFTPQSTYAGIPPAPIIQSVKKVGNVGNTATVMISWTSYRYDLNTGYTVDASYDGVEWWVAGNVSSGSIFNLTVSIPFNQPIWYRVRAISPDGTSANSDVFKIPLGIQ